jgi:hypothetical protein
VGTPQPISTDLVQRQVRVHLDGGVLGDDRALGERAEHAHAAEVLAAAWNR